MEDIDLLPEILRSQSLSEREIVLPYDEALQALDILVKADWALLGWEGWEKDAEGRHGHSYIMGTTSIEQEPGEKWEDYVQRSARFCRATIGADQERWKREGIDSSWTLYFCLTATGKTQT
jgi:hypothetical protein